MLMRPCRRLPQISRLPQRAFAVLTASISFLPGHWQASVPMWPFLQKWTQEN